MQSLSLYTEIADKLVARLKRAGIPSDIDAEELQQVGYREMLRVLRRTAGGHLDGAQHWPGTNGAAALLSRSTSCVCSSFEKNTAVSGSSHRRSASTPYLAQVSSVEFPPALRTRSSCPSGSAVAVGTAVTRCPPHGPVRAELPHTVLTSDTWRRSEHRDRDVKSGSRAARLPGVPGSAPSSNGCGGPPGPRRTPPCGLGSQPGQARPGGRAAGAGARPTGYPPGRCQNLGGTGDYPSIFLQYS